MDMQVILDEMDRQLDRASEYMVEPDSDLDKARYYIGGCAALVDLVRRARIDDPNAVMAEHQLMAWDSMLSGLNLLEKQLDTGKPFLADYPFFQ